MLTRITVPDSKKSHKLMQAYAAYIALHSIPADARADIMGALGADPSAVPSLSNKVIPLPDQLTYANTEHSSNSEDTQAKIKAWNAFGGALEDITGQSPDRYSVNVQGRDTILTSGVPDQHMVMVGNTTDTRDGEASSALRPGSLVVENVKQLASASHQTVLDDGPQLHHADRSSRPATQSAARQARLERIPARVQIAPVAVVANGLERKFIEFYTDPKLVDALKMHRKDMLTSQALNERVTAPN